LFDFFIECGGGYTSWDYERVTFLWLGDFRVESRPALRQRRNGRLTDFSPASAESD
jgi:hypothetical protein